MIEQGQPPPGQGGYTGYRQGIAYASVIQAAIDFELDYRVVRPEVWMEGVRGLVQFRCRKVKRGETANLSKQARRLFEKARKKEKAVNRAKRKRWLLERARKVWPCLPLGRVKDQGIADAAFIAVYGARTFRGVSIPW